MRSLIILEVEHGEDSDALTDFTNAIDIGAFANWVGLKVNDYTVRVDLPEGFVLDSISDFVSDTAPETKVERGVWRHPNGTSCVSFPDSIDWTYTDNKIACPHLVLLTCFRLES